MEAVLGLILVVAVGALVVRFVIRREKKLGNNIVQDVKDLGE
jgi:uncharacterized membrane-anchored protein YhcB (DUF1043 family)